MAVIETNTKSSLHLRSNSLPSSPHPIVSQLEEQLQRLNSSEATSSVSSSSVCNKLNGMQDLQDCIDNLLQLPVEQQALSQESNEKSIDDLLEGSLRLLDICSTAKDCISMSKESIHELQSVIRRGNKTRFTVEGVKYLALRKQMKKQIRKALKNLKAMKNENNTSPMLGFLKEAEAITMSSLEHLLLFISDPKGHSKNNTWSAISMLMHPKRKVCDSQESATNEFEMVDSALQSLISKKSSSSDTVVSEDKKMTATETNTKSSLHTRCNSLPSAPQPFIIQLQEHLRRLKGSEVVSPVSSSSISHKLGDMQDLHDCIDKLLQLPIEKQTLA